MLIEANQIFYNSNLKDKETKEQNIFSKVVKYKLITIHISNVSENNNNLVNYIIFFYIKRKQ